MLLDGAVLHLLRDPGGLDQVAAMLREDLALGRLPHLVTGSADGTLRVWKMAGAAAVRTIQHEGAVAAIAVSPDGATIVFTSNRGGGAMNLYLKPTDGSGEAVRLTEGEQARLRRRRTCRSRSTPPR